MNQLQRTAIISGVLGQDGYYLAELLHTKKYNIVGLATNLNSHAAQKRRVEQPFLKLIECNIENQESIAYLLELERPTEFYNLAGKSFVGDSWKNAKTVAQVNGMAVLGVLDEILKYQQQHGREIKFYQASSSELFGLTNSAPQSELSSFHPNSPYGVAKAFAHHLTVNYRDSYGLFACCGILYNHESPRREPKFVTRKVTQAVARIALGRQKKLVLGNLDIERDWGFAGDYVDAMWRMLQLNKPTDFVVATGVKHSVAELCQVAFGHVGISKWQDYVTHDMAYSRPVDATDLVGDPRRAQELLGWKAQMKFEDLIKNMVRHDLDMETRNLE